MSLLKRLRKGLDSDVIKNFQSAKKPEVLSVYEIIIADKALKKMEKLSKETQARIFNALGRIRIRPEAYVTRLVGQKCYKLRVGDYRLILDIEKNKLLILVINVGHRRNIYKAP